MKLKRPAIAKRAFACLLSLAALSAAAAEREVVKEFPLNDDGQLTVRVDGADIKVIGADIDTVQVRAVVKGPASYVDNYKIDFNADENRLEIRGESPRKSWGMSWGSWGSRGARFTIKAPTRLALDLKTSGGDIEVSRIQGESVVRTSGGDIELKRLEGPVTAKTSGGDLNVSEITGRLTIATSGGDVTVRGAAGDVEAKTSGGDIDLTGVDGQVYARTSGGDIVIELIGDNRGVEARTSGGNIRLKANELIAGDIYARSSGGSVSCDFPVTIRGKLKRNMIEGKLNGGGQAITLSTTGGNIRLVRL